MTITSRTAPPEPYGADGANGNELVAALDGVGKVYGDREVLRDISLTVRRGEFVTLLGASGSGKTTLLRILGSLDLATQGRLEVTPDRSVVFQEPRLLPFRKVSANVRLGIPARARDGLDVDAALAEVGLQGRGADWPNALSGGEAQRVALSRALVRAPKLLLMDEPFAALDALTRLNMQALVLKLWRLHRPGVVFITHDIDEAIALGDRVLVLRDGRISVDIPLIDERPRDRSATQFTAIRRTLLEELGVVP